MYGRRPLVQSPPVPVFWMGFRSDTYQLQQAGWRLYEDKDYHRMQHRFYFSNDMLELCAICDEYDYTQGYSINSELAPLHINGVYHSKNVRIVGTEFSEMNLVEVDATPRVTHSEFPITELFRQKQPEQVFIEQADVSVLERLQEIKRKQDPVQQRIRERIAAEASQSKQPKQETFEVIKIAC